MNAWHTTERKRQINLIRRRTSPFWFVRSMINGERVAFSTRTELKSQASEIGEAVIALGEQIGIEKAIARLIPSHGKNTKSVTPIETFFSYYRETIQNSPKGYNEVTMNQNVREFQKLCNELRVENIQDLSPEMILKWHTSKKGILAPATLNSSFGKCKSLFKKECLYAYRQKGLNVESPFKLVTNPNPYKWQAYKPLNPATRKELLQWILTNENPRYALIGLLALCLGMRRNEISECKTNWIVGKIMNIPADIAKSGRSRNIPIPNGLDFMALRAKVEEYDRLIQGEKMRKILVAKMDSEFLIPTTRIPRKVKPNKASRTYRLSNHFDSYIKAMKARFPTVDFGKSPIHQLRRELGSVYATREGIFVTQRILGHSTPVITAQTYAGLTELPTIGIDNF